MLTETFLASVLNPEKAVPNASNRDVGIFVHEYQPLPGVKSCFKKSSTHSSCVAVNAFHVFAAQADRAVVHVYNRERGNQEAVVPFPERISSVALIGRYDGAGTLVLGTEGGRVLLWELCTGRLISTPPSHLQATTCLAVDPSRNFLLTGSLDSSVYVWSIPALLSFSRASTHDPDQTAPYSPLHTLSNHRAAITAITTGHSRSSVNIAITASRDDTCLVWDYHCGTLLHTFIFASAPLCLSLDPADRALYVGHEDGSIQLIDFYNRPSLIHPIHDAALRTAPTQPPGTDLWTLPEENRSAALCMEMNYDGTCVLSGHRDGKVHSWDIAKGRYGHQVAEFTSGVTNIHMLPPSGFPNEDPPNLKIHSVVKPHYESSLDGSNLSCASNGVPENHAFSAQFFTPSYVSPPGNDPLLSLDRALADPSFPQDMLDQGLVELATFPTGANVQPKSSLTEVDAASEATELAQLKVRLAQAQHLQYSYLQRMADLNDELLRKEDIERRKRRLKRLRRMKDAQQATETRRGGMGLPVGKDAVAILVDEEDKQAIEELSSTAEEYTASD